MLQGTIYIYSGLTGAKEIYMWAFGISMGNEDYATWTLFNKLFSKSCPLVSVVEQGKKFSNCIFLSDRDKDLE